MTHGAVAGDLDAAAHLMPDVGQGDVQVASIGVQLDVREDVSELQSAHGGTEVTGLEGQTQGVSVVDQLGRGGAEVGQTADAEGAVGTATSHASVELVEGPEAVEQADSVRVGSVHGWVGEDDLDWDEGDDSGAAWLSRLTVLTILSILTVLSSGTSHSHGTTSTVSTSRASRTHRASITLRSTHGLEAHLAGAKSGGRHQAQGQEKAEASKKSTHDDC